MERDDLNKIAPDISNTGKGVTKKRKAEIEIENRVDWQFGKIYKTIDETDYVGIGVRRAEEANNARIASLNEISGDIEEISSGIDGAIESYDMFQKEKRPQLNKLKLDEEKFLFPSGNASEIRRKQLLALNYADVCLSTRGTLADNLAVLDEQLEGLKADDGRYLKSTVIVPRGSIFESSSQKALSSVASLSSDKVEVFTKSLVSNRCAEVGEYGLACEIREELKSVGIQSDVVNVGLKNSSEEIRTEKRKNICEQINKAVASEKDFNKQYYDYSLAKLQPHWALIWVPAIAVLIAFALLCNYTALGRFGEGLGWALMYIIPMTIVVGAYLAVFIVNKRKKKNCVSNQLLLDCYTIKKGDEALARFDTKYDISKICRIADEKIFSKYYERACELYARMEELRVKMFEFLRRLNGDVEKINYLPQGMDSTDLPKIIEFMESGAAEDYRSAAVQAVQYNIANALNEAQIAIMEAAEESRKNEARAQREMSEYYERQRLYEAREAAAKQAESARRAEEYARSQAESAKRAADAQAEAAKHAAKQAEAAEELLRRSDDPYYINRWKNGG